MHSSWTWAVFWVRKALYRVVRKHIERLLPRCYRFVDHSDTPRKFVISLPATVPITLKAPSLRILTSRPSSSSRSSPGSRESKEQKRKEKRPEVSRIHRRSGTKTHGRKRNETKWILWCVMVFWLRRRRATAIVFPRGQAWSGILKSINHN